MVNKLNWRQLSRLGPWWMLLGTASDEALMSDLNTALGASSQSLGSSSGWERMSS